MIRIAEWANKPNAAYELRRSAAERHAKVVAERDYCLHMGIVFFLFMSAVMVLTGLAEAVL